MVWSTGRLSLRTSHHIVPLSQQTKPDNVIQKRHFLEKAPRHCSKGMMEKNSYKREQKVNSIYHPLNTLSYVPSPPEWPSFYIFFLHYISNPWGRWNVNTACPFIELKQSSFPLTLSILWPRRAPLEPSLQLNSEMPRDMSLQHQTAAGNYWEKWQTFPP